MHPCRALPFVLLTLTACEAPGAPPGSPAAAHPAAFFAGCWRRTDGAEVSEEVWTIPHGGVMYGQNRTLRGDALLDFELLTIERRGDDWVYVARPGGRRATEFRMTACGPHFVTFENPGHDYPKRIRYRRAGDTLEALIDDGRDGHTTAFGWRAVR